MNHNSIHSNYEDNNQSNNSYNQWQEAMKDVEFQGNKLFATATNQETTPTLTTSETKEEPIDKQSNPESRRSRKSISETLRILSSQEMEYTGEIAIRPRTEIVCDHDHIENQKIDVINKKDRGMTEFRLKLRTPTEAMTTLLARLKNEGGDRRDEITTPSGAVLQRGKITYEGTSSNNSYELCDASVFEKGGVKVFIADPSSRNGGQNISGSSFNKSHLVRTAIGLVKIEAPSDMAPEETEQILGEILEKDLGVPDALNEVPEKAEKEYKVARYKWQHAITGDLTPEQTEQAEKLDREEVFPGYTTLVERGKHKEYLERYGEDVRVIHHLNTGDAKSIYRVLTQGLMCTTERYSRGIMKNGMSSITDMDTGGADSVFTRIANEAQRGIMGGSIVVFKPEVFDRTDWYSYDCDTFGSTDDELFAKRLSPDAILAKTTNPNDYYPSGNEQMFRTGIDSRFIESIEVSSWARNEIIANLHSMGLEEINGKPIEEIVISHKLPTPETTSDSSIDWGISDQSLEEFEAKLKQEQAEKQKEIQALINGEKSYTSIDEIIELAFAGNNYCDTIKSITESLIAQGKKEQLSNDMSEYLKKALNLDELKAMASGEVNNNNYYDEDDKELFTYFQDALGIDYDTLYKEALASQQKTSSPEPWPDWPSNWEDWDWNSSTPTPTPTPPPQTLPLEHSSNEFDDDWM